MPSGTTEEKTKKARQEESGAPVRTLLIEGQDKETLIHLEEAASHSDIGNALHRALKSRYSDTGKWCWISDVYPDAVVYEISSQGKRRFYRSTYTYDEKKGEATVSEDMEQVVRKTVYEPVPKIEESGRPMPAESIRALSEAEIDPKKHDLIRLINPGKGSSGFYSEAVLKRAAKSKAFKAGLPIFIDHATVTERREKPERSWKDMAGHTVTDAFWQEHAKEGPGLYAYANFYSAVRDEVREKKDASGLSVVADGTIREGQVEEISAGFSCDLVTFPGRGGKVIELAESDRSRAEGMKLHESIHIIVEAEPAPAEDVSTPPPKPPSEPVVGESTTAPQPEDIMSTANSSQAGTSPASAPASSALVQEAKLGKIEEMSLEEARRTALSFRTVNEALEARNSTLQSELKEAQTRMANQQLELDRLGRRLEGYRAKEFVESKLDGFKDLPPVLRERLRKELPLHMPIEGGEVKESAALPIIENNVREMMDFAASLTGAGSVRGNGGEIKESMADLDAQLEAEFLRGGLPETAAKSAAYGGRGLPSY